MLSNLIHASCIKYGLLFPAHYRIFIGVSPAAVLDHSVRGACLSMVVSGGPLHAAWGRCVSELEIHPAIVEQPAALGTSHHQLNRAYEQDLHAIAERKDRIAATALLDMRLRIGLCARLLHRGAPASLFFQ